MELETWLVQQELGPFPVEYPDQPIFMESASAAVQRDQTVPPVVLPAVLSNLEEEEDKEV